MNLKDRFRKAKLLFEFANSIFLINAIILIGSFGCAKPKLYVRTTPDQKGIQSENKKGNEGLILFNQDQNALEWDWIQKPTEFEVGTFYFKIYQKDPIDFSWVRMNLEELPEIELWMPSMNHGSTPVIVSKTDENSFFANDVFFIMPGDWDIRFKIKVGNQYETVVDSLIFSFND